MYKFKFYFREQRTFDIHNLMNEVKILRIKCLINEKMIDGKRFVSTIQSVN